MLQAQDELSVLGKHAKTNKVGSAVLLMVIALLMMVQSSLSIWTYNNAATWKGSTSEEVGNTGGTAKGIQITSIILLCVSLLMIGLSIALIYKFAQTPKGA